MLLECIVFEIKGKKIIENSTNVTSHFLEFDDFVVQLRLIIGQIQVHSLS